jgi:hypothetical protein
MVGEKSSSWSSGAGHTGEKMEVSARLRVHVFKYILGAGLSCVEFGREMVSPVVDVVGTHL